ncbi:MAG: ABC transporter ATP-binding protein [Bacilli bacterium]|nr:ABC transporter ATP-binding protein [Bacilli bacterium]
MAAEYTIEMINITKRFANIVANDHISLRIEKGEILGLCGENGAGKSTLMSILFGLFQPDEGEIRKDGKVVEIKNPNDATALNIGMIHQHFKLVEAYTVLQNIILGSEPLWEIKKDKLTIFDRFLNFINKKVLKIIDYKAASDKVQKIVDKYGFNIDLNAKISDISVEMQQKVEIIKTLYRDNDILIFDEPTAVLTEQEIDGLLKIMLNLKKEGKSIVFISHKMNEIFKVCDRITVIRKGQHVKDLLTSETTKEEISMLMVGREVKLDVEKPAPNIGKEILRVDNLSLIDKETKKKIVNNVSFNVREGEIVTIAGIDGNGQQDLIYAITGINQANSGKLFFNGEDISSYSIRKKNRIGLSHIPEDRHKHGLVLDYSINKNVVLKEYNLKQFSKYGFIKDKEIKKYSKGIIEKFDVRASSEGDTVTRTMSGGNQQKVIIGRELTRKHDLVIAVQPIRGLDIGSIETIHNILLNERNSGKAVLLVSLELDEVFTLSDRILIMFEGEIVGEFNPKETTREQLGLYMSGAKKDKVNAVKEGCYNEQN